MEKQLPYTTTIKSRPLFYIETQKLAELHMQGFDEQQIKDEVITQNIFQVKTETRKREIANTIIRRLQVLDDYLIGKIVTGDMNTGKLVVLYAIVQTDRLFYEFMNEVFSEKFALQVLALEDRDFNIFFETKRQQSEKVAAWKDYTFYKLQQVYTRILFEAGLLKKHGPKWEIQIPLIDPDVLDHIRQSGEQRFIHAIVGGDKV